jgi:hypothetical protein
MAGMDMHEMMGFPEVWAFESKWAEDELEDEAAE